jgi:ribosomal peptide maturation radical SAM protein 1
MEDLDLLLVSLPWAKVDHLSIQIGGLKAYLEANGLRVGARHYYRDIVEYLPLPVIDSLFETNAGEFISLSLLWPEVIGAVDDKLAEILPEPIDAAWLREVLSGFVSDVCDDILAAASATTVVGFTTTLQQVTTSLLVARELKRRRPEQKILVGGAILIRRNAADFVRSFEQIDFAIHGEGEVAALRLLEVLRRDKGALCEVPSLVYRDGGQVVCNDGHEAADLGHLPIPSFDEYFSESLRPRRIELYPKITCETSRGCFYDKCSFCNLNAQWQKRYRSKANVQVLEELQTQVARYGTARILFVDTNISNRPALFRMMARAPEHFHAWAEVSAHLTRDTFVAMRAAGVRDIQIGIESFSQPLLDGFEKGVTVMRNMEMLKWCVELDYDVFYNILIHYPTETHADAEATIRALQFARWFQPPAFSEFMLTVESPLERATREEAERAGTPHESVPEPLTRMMPAAAQRSLGPLLAPFVGGRVRSGDVDWSPARSLVEEWRKVWARNGGRPALLARAAGDRLVLTNRYGAREEYIRLDPMESAIYRACMKEARRDEDLARESGMHEADFAYCLADLEGRGLLFRSAGRSLALAVWEDAKAMELVQPAVVASPAARSLPLLHAGG